MFPSPPKLASQNHPTYTSMKLTWSLLLFFILLAGRGQDRYTVIIQEFMPDPSPAVGLPPNEWIEIRNRGNTEVNLQGWRLGDGVSVSGPLPFLLLKPDSLLIICRTTGVAAMSAYGRTAGITGFPSLDNDGDTITLLNNAGALIHAVGYDAGWHTNSLKRNGGWSLEMIDIANYCSGKQNWSSSTNPAGGTPGAMNNVTAVNPDRDPPQLLRAYCPDSSSIVLVFNETIDSLKASRLTAYHNAGAVFTGAFPITPLYNEVRLTTSTPLAGGLIHSIDVKDICDCQLNAMPESVARAGIPAAAVAGDLAINEVLFNPVPSGYDYIELLNRGTRIIDLAGIYVANRNNAGQPDNVVPVSGTPQLMFPGDYYTITTDPEKLVMHFVTKHPDQVHTVPSMPSMPDDKGTVLLLDKQGVILEELNYSEKWQFPLLNEREGVALERIDPDRGTGQENWHSAATSAGYGTPGYRNSQALPDLMPGAGIRIEPKTFSPDNNGLDDQCFIHFTLPEPGYVANLFIFDQSGHLVRQLVSGDLLAGTGYWIWDGLDENKNRLKTGPYIVLTEVFNLQGKTKKFKNVVVLFSRN